MYENYTKALAVLEVLEWAERRIATNKPLRLVAKLRREGLYLEKSVAYLMDSLRPNEALRFRNAMAITITESHFARLNKEDREFIRIEGPATTGFYLAYINGDHEKIIELARQMLLGIRKFRGYSPDLIETASVLVTGPTWVVNVLLPEIDPRYRAMIEPRVNMLLDSALEIAKDRPIPEACREQLKKLKNSLSYYHN